MATPDFSDVEWIANTDQVRVRILTLGPGGGTAWHRHTSVHDDVFGVDAVEVQVREPALTVKLAAGERFRIEAGRAHRVVNPGRAPARYLLVQATGPYDFVELS